MCRIFGSTCKRVEPSHLIQRRSRTSTNNSEDGVRLRNDPLLGGVSNNATTRLRDGLPKYLGESVMSV
jgi:hypothetical protein